MTTMNNLIQILLPTNGGDDGVFERLAQELTAKFGGVVGTAFKAFPSYPQRYTEVVDDQPEFGGDLSVRVEPLKAPLQTQYTTDDLYIRQFLPETSRRLVRTGEHRAA